MYQYENTELLLSKSEITTAIISLIKLFMNLVIFKYMISTKQRNF